MPEELGSKNSMRIAYVSVSQGIYLSDVQIFKIHYNRMLRLISFLRFVLAVIASHASTEVIIGNSKILEFRCLRYILKILPHRNISYVNDFYLDTICDILNLKSYDFVNKIYMLEKSDEEIKIIKDYFDIFVAIHPLMIRNVDKLEGCTILSVKPIMQFPIKYWPAVYLYLLRVRDQKKIDFITFHPRVGKLERTLYSKLFYSSVEVNANVTEFKYTDFFGFYSSFMIGGRCNCLSLIRFDGYRPYEEFLDRINHK